MPYRRLSLIAVLVACAGCTGIGVHTKERGLVDYGPPQVLDICLLKAPQVKQERADSLIASVNKEFAPYGILVQVPWIRDWKRPGFTVTTIIEDLMTRDVEAPCDRIVGLVDRHAGDFFWGLLLPEVLGAVEEVTRTRGYVVANWASLNQIGADPNRAMVHEFYHLVGCGHGVSKTKCYHAIAAMKSRVPSDSDFYPGMSEKGEFFLTRDEANAAMRKYLEEEAAKAEEKKKRR